MYFNIQNKQLNRDNLCFERLGNLLDNGISAQEIFLSDYGKLQLLVEQSLVSRSEMLKVANSLNKDNDVQLTSRDLLVLKEGSESYLEIRDDLFKIAYAYECALDVSDETLAKYDINNEMHLKGLMLSLGAALTLYDNYFLGIVLFQQDERLRKILNDPDMGFGLVANKLEEVTLNVNSIEIRHRMRRAITFYEEKSVNLEITNDEEYEYLKLLIESSPSYNYVKEIRVGKIASNKLSAFEKITEDRISEISKDGFDIVSKLFGNTLGLFESRKGKLYGNEEVTQKIKNVLKPLDIILEKTPFRLTDKFIPGHFGHVAIWTGTKSELIDLGIWENQQIKQYANEISSENNPDSKDEHQIIEALRSGVQLSSLEDFMNVDDIAILRPVFKEKDNQPLTKEAIEMAFRQIGKKYDFNFDVNTTDKIVCSELAYISFPSIDWPTEKTLGRYSISPDNVAQLAWNNIPLELVLFYHDGKLVPDDIKVKKMKSLMQE